MYPLELRKIILILEIRRKREQHIFFSDILGHFVNSPPLDYLLFLENIALKLHVAWRFFSYKKDHPESCCLIIPVGPEQTLCLT